MRIRHIILFLFLFGSTVSFAQSDYRSFIPAGYDTLYSGYITGDLNKDGISDVVMALYDTVENAEDHINTDNLRPRLLVILLGSESGYKLALSSKSAILCKHCGGIFGDPFSGIAIEKGVLQLYHYGGSAWRWSLTHKFRYQNNDWFLIGKTSISYWNVEVCEKLDVHAGWEYEDVNLLTGQYEVKKVSQDCKLLEDKKGKRKRESLVSLTKFSIDN